MDKNGLQKAKIRQEKTKNGKKDPGLHKDQSRLQVLKQKVAKMAKKYFSLQKRQEIVKNGQNVKNSPKLAKIAINEIFCRYGKMNQFQRNLKKPSRPLVHSISDG